MKKVLFLAVAATLFVACTNNTTTTSTDADSTTISADTTGVCCPDSVEVDELEVIAVDSIN